MKPVMICAKRPAKLILVALFVLTLKPSICAQLLVDGGTTTLSAPYSYPTGTTVKNGTLIIDSGYIDGGSSVTTVGLNSGDVGSLILKSGGIISDLEGTVGASAGSQGVVTVTGIGSLWQNSTGLMVGQRGSASLVVTNGGEVTNAYSTIGVAAGSHGTATIDGTGSMLTNSSNLDVGHFGDGSLAITNGGQVVSREVAVARWAGSQGSLTIDGAGSNLTATTGSISVGSNLRLPENTYAGPARNSIISITNGGSLVSHGGSIGSSGGVGIVTVDGVGSTWTNSTYNLIVGSLSASTGSLSITNGGSVNTTSLHTDVGLGIGSTGTVTVDGAGSRLSVTGAGHFGIGSGASTGSLQIINGGEVTNNTNNSVIGSGANITGMIGSVGSVLVSGHGSTWTSNTTRGMTIGSGFLSLGIVSTGTLTITNDGVVIESKSISIAPDASGIGVVTVDGGHLQTPVITIGSGGTLNFNSTSAASGTVASSTISNAGLISINTRAPITGVADTRSISGILTNQISGTVQVGLNNDATISFQGAVLNNGQFHVTQQSGTTNGTVNFNGGFTNNGTYTQDPTTTHFDSLTNNGQINAGLGDIIVVDGSFVNNGTIDLIGSELFANAGLENYGALYVYGGANINGAYSGDGSFVFHVSSTNDRIIFSDLFRGSLEIVFDPFYTTFGNEHFIHFGGGAYLSNLIIGGTSYQPSFFDGPGYLTGNGSFFSSSVASAPDAASTAVFLAYAFLLLIVIKRRIVLGRKT